MQPIKFKRVEIRKPKWDPNPNKSTMDNSDWRKGMFIVFEDYNGQEYDYMPKWDELTTIYIERDNIEKLNKQLAKEVQNGIARS